MNSDYEKLYLLKIPEVQELILQAFQDMCDRAVIKDLINAIEYGTIDDVIDVCGFTPALLDDVITKINEIYKSSAVLQTAEYAVKIEGLKPVFNMRNTIVERQLIEFSSRFISEISSQVKSSVQVVLSEGYSRGDNPRTTALNIVGRIDPSTKKRTGGILGLTTNQASWSNSARTYLENLDSKYLKMKLRDRRFDSIVKKAIEEKKPLSKDTISKLVMSYNNRALKYRADAIARTETIQAINRGKAASIEQGISEGLFKASSVQKWWDDTGDARTRLSHVELGKRYSRKNAISYNEPFRTIGGSSLMFPGDTSLGADASEVIHCRCSVIYKVDFIKEANNG